MSGRAELMPTRDRVGLGLNADVMTMTTMRLMARCCHSYRLVNSSLGVQRGKGLQVM